MRPKPIWFFFLFCLFLSSPLALNGQVLDKYVQQVDTSRLKLGVREFSGEDSCLVNGVKVRIQHRVSRRNNNLAAAYLFERLDSLGLNPIEHNYRSGGRNIIGALEGRVHPKRYYIVGAHYDAVADYCADDNASGSMAVMEAARIMSGNCFDHTVLFAFWDEEERGLIGSKFYAQEAAARGDTILGVINMDMLGWDGDSDRVFDIHTNNLIDNQALKDTLLYLVDTLNLNLTPQVMNPGTNRSDHAAFWNEDYPAVFFGESFLGGDPNPFYHSSKDRISEFHMGYFFDLCRLATGATIQLANPYEPPTLSLSASACESYVYLGDTLRMSQIRYDTFVDRFQCDSIVKMDLNVIHIDNGISQLGRMLSSDDTSSLYQWVRCVDGDLLPLIGDTLRQFEVANDGSYAVVLSKDKCMDTSQCRELLVSSTQHLKEDLISIYPNPSDGILHIDFSTKLNAQIELLDMRGREVFQKKVNDQHSTILQLPEEAAVYILRMHFDDHSITKRVIKK